MTKAVDVFQGLVHERGDLLRRLTFEQLIQPEVRKVEYVAVESRRGRITTIVDQGTLPSGGIRVVVQGFLKKRFLPTAWNVALDGFYKYPDETTAPLTREDMWEFD
ncbi:MAG TPA: hypothetical protein VII23_18225 [Terriglobales bacterium]